MTNTGITLWAEFIPQMENGKRIVPDRKNKPYKFDITKQIEKMGERKALRLESDIEETDWLWKDNPISKRKPHDGPFAVRVDESEIYEFFENRKKREEAKP